jgi:hypothetical protein
MKTTQPFAGIVTGWLARCIRWKGAEAVDAMGLFDNWRRDLGVAFARVWRVRAYLNFPGSPRKSRTAATLLALSGLLLGTAIGHAGLSVRDQEAELEAAMVCASARQSANSCEVQACFAHYLANTPPGDVAPLATQTLSEPPTAS